MLDNDGEAAMRDAYEAVIMMLLDEIVKSSSRNEKLKTRIEELVQKTEIQEMTTQSRETAEKGDSDG